MEGGIPLDGLLEGRLQEEWRHLEEDQSFMIETGLRTPQELTKEEVPMMSVVAVEGIHEEEKALLVVKGGGGDDP